MELLIKNARVLDGTGKPPFEANLGIEGGSISYIGPEAPEAAQLMDAGGMCLAPGFIDAHSHSDYTLPVYPDAQSAIAQGITTMCAGNCGMSPSPCHRLYLPFSFEERALAEVLPEPFGGVNPGFMQTVPAELLHEPFRKLYGVDLNWRSFGEYVRHLRETGIAPNLMAAVGHGAARCQVMGADIHRPASAEETGEICRICAQSMDEGAIGVSLGLDYDPGNWADEAELEAVVRCTAEKGKTLFVHYQMRPARRGAQIPGHTSVDGLLEVLSLARRTGVHLHLSHLSASFDIRPYDRKLAELGARRVMEIVEEHRALGMKVTYDALANYTGGDFFYPNIAQRFLPYVLQAGGMEAFSRALRTGNYKRLIADDICAGRHPSSSVMTRLDPLAAPAWGGSALITRCSDERCVGKTIGELCRERGCGYVELLLDILEADPFACYNMWSGAEGAVDTEVFLSVPDMPLGLDVSAVDYVQRTAFADGRPENKRSTGTYCGFVKYLTSGREPLETMVRHLTSAAAEALGLSDRGRVEPGFAADLVLFDPAKLDARENFAEPAQRPAGIDSVFVNGAPVLLRGRFTGARPGEVLTR